MSIKQRDRNRAELIKAIIRQNGGRIFTVIAKRKSPKRYFIVGQVPEMSWYTMYLGVKTYLNTKKAQKLLEELQEAEGVVVNVIEDNFMEMTCRTGVHKDLAGGKSTIAHKDDLISVNLTNGKGYRCFSAYNVLEIRAGGAVLKFKEQHVLEFEGE